MSTQSLHYGRKEIEGFATMRKQVDGICRQMKQSHLFMNTPGQIAINPEPKIPTVPAKGEPEPIDLKE